jgi:hypothetical protein
MLRVGIPVPLPVYSSGVQVLGPLNTSDNTFQSFTIPGKTMGPNTTLRATALFTCPTNANTKTFRVRWGGNVIYQASFTTTTITVFIEVLLQNRGVLNAQVGQPVAILGPAFTAGPIQTWAIDTTVDQIVSFSGQAGVGTDQLTLERCSVELFG